MSAPADAHQVCAVGDALFYKLFVCAVARVTSKRALLTGSQSSGVMTSLSEADGLAVIAPGTTVAEGDWVEVMPLSAL